MTPEQLQGVRRLLARHARELAEGLTKCPEEAASTWHREARAAHAHLTAALGAELKVCPDDAVVAMLRKKVASIASRHADDDWVEAHACYVSLRLTLRDLRDEAHADAGKTAREFAFGLIYDAMGWTDLSKAFTDAALEALDVAVAEAAVAELREGYAEVRRRLLTGGFNVMPQPAGA
jgi:hypothetical protein